MIEKKEWGDAGQEKLAATFGMKYKGMETEFKMDPPPPLEGAKSESGKGEKKERIKLAPSKGRRT